LTCLIEFSIPTFVGKFLRQDAICPKIQFRCRPIASVRDVAELKENIPISINTMVTAFDGTRSLLRLALKHGMYPPGNRGKHIVLDQHSEQPILHCNRQTAKGSIPVTRQEVKRYSTRHFQTAITRDWVHLFVLCSHLEIIHMKSVPQDEQRLHVSQAFLHPIVQDLKEYIEKCTTQLAFNLDEVGILD
jgi:hypothetical protein